MWISEFSASSIAPSQPQYKISMLVHIMIKDHVFDSHVDMV